MAWDAIITDERGLLAELPCCGVVVSLNDLEFRSSHGFARCALFVWEPAKNGLADPALDKSAFEQQIADVEARVSEAIGRSLRLIWRQV